MGLVVLLSNFHTDKQTDRDRETETEREKERNREREREKEREKTLCTSILNFNFCNFCDLHVCVRLFQVVSGHAINITFSILIHSWCIFVCCNLCLMAIEKGVRPKL